VNIRGGTGVLGSLDNRLESGEIWLPLMMKKPRCEGGALEMYASIAVVRGASTGGVVFMVHLDGRTGKLKW
jgi:hypothetical protein